MAEHRYPERTVASPQDPSSWACGYPTSCPGAGRSDAALRRVARYGDGWLGLWVSPARCASATALIAKCAADADRDVLTWEHGMHGWCGFGTSPGAARGRLSVAMEGFLPASVRKI